MPPPMSEFLSSPNAPPVRPRPPGPGKAPRLLVVAGNSDESTAAMLRGVARHQQQSGGRSVLADELPDAPEELRELLAHGWDGVVGCATSATLAAACAAAGLPLVVLGDAPVGGGEHRIRPDAVSIGAMGGEFFLERGFRRFAFVEGDGTERTRECAAGFAEAVELAGLEVAVLGLAAPAGGLAVSPMRRALEQWLRTVPKPVAVMASDDRCAMRVLESAHASGCLVPEEVAVLGVGNETARCELATPTLSSIDPGWFECGFQAARLLGQRREQPAVAPCDLRLDPAGVVPRRSTDVSAVRDPVVSAAVRRIAEHACGGLTVGDLVRQGAVSRAQLEKKFRRHLGRSPQSEIRRVQIACIRQLLADTELPLKAIAERTGFAYPEHLCVVFRRLTGETPGAYRRRQSLRGPAGGDGMPGTEGAESDRVVGSSG